MHLPFLCFFSINTHWEWRREYNRERSIAHTSALYIFSSIKSTRHRSLSLSTQVLLVRAIPPVYSTFADSTVYCSSMGARYTPPTSLHANFFDCSNVYVRQKLKMLQNYLSFTVIATLFICFMLATAKLPESVPSSDEIENIRYAESLSFSSGQCTQIFLSVFCSKSERKS